MIWAPVMFCNEWSMLKGRLETFGAARVRHVLAESPHTHRGVPKPLHYHEAARGGDPFPGHRIAIVAAEQEPDPDPWVNEHRQRNAAWGTIDREAADGDVVLIADLDELPSPELLDFAASWAPLNAEPEVMSVPMRTYLFAVDWQAAGPLPPACVMATVAYLRRRAALGEGLAGVRDSRDRYPVFEGFGGWHLSWMGGPEAHKAKLLTSTCHTELLDSPEGGLIASGERWRTDQDGGGLPVIPVDVDETWPRFVYERRCPSSWYRPRDAV